MVAFLMRETTRIRFGLDGSPVYLKFVDVLLGSTQGIIQEETIGLRESISQGTQIVLLDTWLQVVQICIATHKGEICHGDELSSFAA